MNENRRATSGNLRSAQIGASLVRVSVDCISDLFELRDIPGKGQCSSDSSRTQFRLLVLYYRLSSLTNNRTRSQFERAVRPCCDNFIADNAGLNALFFMPWKKDLLFSVSSPL
jgi:hypothetical protein